MFLTLLMTNAVTGIHFFIKLSTNMPQSSEFKLASSSMATTGYLKKQESRNYYLNKFRKRRKPADWDVFHELRNVVRKRLRDNKQSYFESLSKEMGAIPKRV